MTAQSTAPDNHTIRVQIGRKLDRWIRPPLAALSFWAAIVIPVLYVPLLVGGIESIEGLVLFSSLFGLHVVALFGGRKYHPRRVT